MKAKNKTTTIISVTVNNYQYWYNTETKVVYLDIDCKNELPKNSFNAQEMSQFYNDLQRKLTVL